MATKKKAAKRSTKKSARVMGLRPAALVVPAALEAAASKVKRGGRRAKKKKTNPVAEAFALGRALGRIEGEMGIE